MNFAENQKPRGGRRIAPPAAPVPMRPEASEFLFLRDPPYRAAPSVPDNPRRPLPRSGPRKRFFAAVVAVCAVLASVMPVFAVGDLALLSPHRSGIPHYDEIYDAVYDAVASGKESLDLYDYSVSVDDFMQIYSDLFTTAPEFYFLSPRVVYHTSDTLFAQHVVDVYFTYDMSRNEIEAASAFYEKELDYIVSLVPEGLSEAERALFVHDYLISAYAYDASETIYDVHTMFRTREGVCQAYALAYCAILRELGMESALAVSPKMGHAWNVVKVDGRWYHVDLVYDDPQPDRCGRVLHDYFMLTDREMKAKDHYGWETVMQCDGDPYSASPIWRGVDSRMIPLDGKWYYIDSSSRKLCRSAFNRSGKEEILEFSDRWVLSENSQRYWVGVFSGLSLWQGRLVLNGPGEIWLFDPETCVIEPLYDPKGTIYGSNVYKGELEYLISDTPNLEGGEPVYSIKLDSMDSLFKPLPFEDIPAESIYYPAVKYVYFAELFKGVSENRFDSASSFSRAMFVTVLSRLYGADLTEPAGSSFTDVLPGEWYSAPVEWAFSEGLVNGCGDGRFDPAGCLTREQMYKIIAASGKSLGIGKPADPALLGSYSDASDLHDWAAEGAAWCAANGLLYGGSALEPAKTVTRGEAAVMFAAFAHLTGNSE